MGVRHHPVPVLSCSDGKTEKQRVPFGFFWQTLNEGPLCAGDWGQTKNLTHGLYQLMGQLMAPVLWWWVVDTGREEWLPVSLLPFFIPPFIILVSLSLSLFLFFWIVVIFSALGGFVFTRQKWAGSSISNSKDMFDHFCPFQRPGYKM